MRSTETENDDKNEIKIPKRARTKNENICVVYLTIIQVCNFTVSPNLREFVSAGFFDVVPSYQRRDTKIKKKQFLSATGFDPPTEIFVRFCARLFYFALFCLAVVAQPKQQRAHKVHTKYKQTGWRKKGGQLETRSKGQKGFQMGSAYLVLFILFGNRCDDLNSLLQPI